VLAWWAQRGRMLTSWDECGAIFQGGSRHIKNNTLYHVNKNNGGIMLEKTII